MQEVGSWSINITDDLAPMDSEEECFDEEHGSVNVEEDPKDELDDIIQ